MVRLGPRLEAASPDHHVKKGVEEQNHIRPRDNALKASQPLDPLDFRHSLLELTRSRRHDPLREPAQAIGIFPVPNVLRIIASPELEGCFLWLLSWSSMVFSMVSRLEELRQVASWPSPSRPCAPRHPSTCSCHSEAAPGHPNRASQAPHR